jgi:hypothetical protein
VLNDPRRRGRRRRPDRCVDALKVLPGGDRGDVRGGAGADLHRAPHPRLAALRQLPRSQEGRLALRPIYSAPNADALVELERFEAEWSERYPPMVQAWRAS